MGMPFLMARSADGTLHAFHNVRLFPNSADMHAQGRGHVLA